MNLREITPDQKNQYNKLVTHLIQSWEWGEFRKSQGLTLLRYGLYRDSQLKTAFQLTIHPIPFTKYTVGYLPKGPMPDQEFAQALEEIGQKYHCAFIKIEPNITSNVKPFIISPKFLPSLKPLFTKHSFLIDLTQPEETLLSNLHPKTRYNIKLAQKKGVKVEERLDDQAFEIYLELYFQTTTRQGYHGHNRDYHRAVWKTFKKAGLATILIGSYQNTPLSAWMLIKFKDTLYYPYGGSSQQHREVMANNLVAWEAIKLGKKWDAKNFDMWGALSDNPDIKNPWYGFHRFKAGYGGKLVEYIGSFDLVFKSLLYFAFNSIDKFTNLKVLLLKLIGK